MTEEILEHLGEGGGVERKMLYFFWNCFFR
jgi:hypothetical protein